MTSGRVLAIVQAGGQGGRMDVLTRERAKPALPFAGVYQLIDFSLSNASHSGIRDVWLSVQFQGSTLEEEVANGRPWDLDATRGGLRLLMPQEGTGSMDEDGFAKGNADELFRIRDQVSAFDPEAVVVMSADHVYRFDFREALATHRRTGAECTVVTTTVDIEEAGEHATVEAGADGIVTRFDYKPDEPTTDVVATEVFVYDPAVLREVLEELHHELTQDADQGDTGLGDFGEHLLPRLVGRGKVLAHPMPGYWRDLGQPHLYLRAHRDVLADDVDVLDVPTWPILTRSPQRRAARVVEGGELVDSLVSPGTLVAGRVVRSVLGPGVVVESGAQVSDSVVFRDTRVQAGARVDWSIIDARCVIGPEAVVGAPDARGFDDSDQVTLVGSDSTVGVGVHLAAGARLEPGSTA